MVADKNDVMPLLKTARGQVEGLIKMVEDDRYCVDISTQILACRALLDKCNKIILSAHVKGCVAQALKSGDDSKIDEVIALLDKMAK